MNDDIKKNIASLIANQKRVNEDRQDLKENIGKALKKINVSNLETNVYIAKVKEKRLVQSLKLEKLTEHGKQVDQELVKISENIRDLTNQAREKEASINELKGFIGKEEKSGGKIHTKIAQMNDELKKIDNEKSNLLLNIKQADDLLEIINSVQTNEHKISELKIKSQDLNTQIEKQTELFYEKQDIINEMNNNLLHLTETYEEKKAELEEQKMKVTSLSKDLQSIRHIIHQEKNEDNRLSSLIETERERIKNNISEWQQLNRARNLYLEER